MENETKNELITEGQELIAIYMGLPVNHQYGLEVQLPPDNPSKNGYWVRPQYNESWDWLMPVWIKFRDLEYQERMLNHSHWRFIISNQLYFAKDPSELFPLLVSAIKWYFET